MARRAKKTEKKGPGLQDIKKMWKVCPPQQWLGLLNDIAPQQDWEMKGHSQIMGKCPYHADNSPSFMLSFDKGMGKCFGGSCGKFVTDIISLVAKLRNCNYIEALLFVSNQFGLKDTGTVKQTEFTAYNTVQEVKKEAAVAMSKIVSQVLRDHPPHLAYCEPTIDYLLSVRKIPREVLHLLPVGVFAKPVHMKEYISEELHSQYDAYFDKYNKDTYYGNLCFYFNDSPGTISRFKFRQKNQNVVKSLKNYTDFLDLPMKQKEGLFERGSTLYLTDPYSEFEGVYGLYSYQHLVASQDTNAYLTEGEFDVLSVMANQFQTGNIDFMIFGTGGKGATNVHFLKEYGIRTIWTVPDHPSKGGDGWVKAVLGTKGNFATEVGQNALQFKVFMWPIGIAGFDLDEAVKHQGYEVMAKYLSTDRNANFLNYRTWVEGLVSQELDDIKATYKLKYEKVKNEEGTETEKTTALNNLKSEEAQAKSSVVLANYRYINEPVAQAAYSNKFATEYGVDISSQEQVNTSGFDLTTASGVADKIKAALAERIAFGYYIEKSGGSSIYGWSKSGQTAMEIQTKETELFKCLSIHLGQETIDWVDALLQNNSVYLAESREAEPGSLHEERAKRKSAKDLFTKAIDRAIAGLKNFTQLRSITQGIHYVDLPKSGDMKDHVYMINGHNIFKGTYVDTQQIEWEKLENVVDGNILFDSLSSANQWSAIADVSDLYDANKVDTAKVFSQVRRALDGWVFKHHDVMAEFLAVQIMSLPIMSAVGNINITFLTGRSNSGKSSFVEGLLGGTNMLAAAESSYSVLESAKVAGDTTNAAIYQTMDGSGQTLVLDEAESKSKNQQATREKNLQDFIRTIYGMPQAPILVNRGGKTKEDTKQYRLKFPLVFAAIATPPDTVFLSRCIMVETSKQTSAHKPAGMYMEENFTPDQLRELRKQITMGLLPHLPEMTVRIKTLRNEIRAKSKHHNISSNRFLEGLLTPLVVYEMAGKDPVWLYDAIVEKNRAQLANIHTPTAQNELLNAALFSKAIKITSYDGMAEFVSARQLIVSMDFTALNNAECGVYAMENANRIVFVWRQAKYSVLKQTQFYNFSEASLKDLAHKSHFAQDNVEPETHKQIVSELSLPDVSGPGDYTIITGDYLAAGGSLKTITDRPDAAQSTENADPAPPADNPDTEEPATKENIDEVGLFEEFDL